jgi:hypothetical protein
MPKKQKAKKAPASQPPAAAAAAAASSGRDARCYDRGGRKLWRDLINFQDWKLIILIGHAHHGSAGAIDRRVLAAAALRVSHRRSSAVREMGAAAGAQ